MFNVFSFSAIKAEKYNNLQTWRRKKLDTFFRWINKTNQADVESNIACYQLNNEMCGSETIDSLVTSWNKLNVTEHLIQIAQNYDNAQAQI